MFGRRISIVAGGMVAAAGLATALAAPAFADLGTGPYFWDCGSSRSGGMHVEAYGQRIEVDITPNGGSTTTHTFTGNVSVDVDGGPVGTAYVHVSNEGGISPNTRTFCSGTP